MRKIYFSDIFNAARTMHANHGKGDIKHIRKFADGVLEIESKCTSCKPHIARGRIETSKTGGQTIKIYGHQMTVHIT